MVLLITDESRLVILVHKNFKHSKSQQAIIQNMQCHLQLIQPHSKTIKAIECKNTKESPLCLLPHSVIGMAENGL